MKNLSFNRKGKPNGAVNNKKVGIDGNADPRVEKLLYHMWQALSRKLKEEPKGTRVEVFLVYVV